MYRNFKDEELDGALESLIWKMLWMCLKTRDNGDDHDVTPLLPPRTCTVEVRNC
jgi:hypothetical protein